MKPDRKKNQNISGRAESAKPIRSKAEDNEPSIGPSTMPVWLFFVLAVFIYWGFVYLDQHAGGFNPKVYGSYESTNQLVALNPNPESEEVKLGRKAYQDICYPCHQANGMGLPGQFPPLGGSEWVLAPEADRLARIVLNGLQGPVQVKGADYNNAMPPFKDNLNDKQLAGVLTYIRSQFGNKAPAVSVEKVAAIRKETANRTQQWTAEELQKIPVGQ